MVRRQLRSASLWSPRNKLDAELKSAEQNGKAHSLWRQGTGPHAASTPDPTLFQSMREEAFRARGPRWPLRTMAPSQHRTMLSRLLSLGSPQTPRSSPQAHAAARLRAGGRECGMVGLPPAGTLSLFQHMVLAPQSAQNRRLHDGLYV